MNEKNRLLHSSIVESVNKAIKDAAKAPTYANAAVGLAQGAIPKINVQAAGAGHGVNAGVEHSAGVNG